MADLFGGKRWRGGRGKTRFCFTYEDLASVFLTTESNVRRMVCDGRVDPHSLASICAQYERRRGG
jgi:hypothetical protein